MKKKRKGITGGIHRCPYCGSPVTYRSADGIYKDNSRGTMLYVCSHYPECDAYVRVHTGTNIPVGTMADRKLRKLRNEAHKHFSKLIRDDYMTKQEAYQWLAGLLGAPQREAHIGYLSEYYCNIVIEESKKEYERYLRKKRERNHASDCRQKAILPRRGRIALSANERIAEFLDFAIQAKFAYVNKLSRDDLSRFSQAHKVH